MKKILLVLAFLPLLAGAQSTTAKSTAEAENKDGMKFEHGSWADILAKAKKENKYIIMDCFTTWCGPCKYMDTKIFPTKEAGDFYNEKFLNVRVQFDSTDKDNAEVKAWHNDMKAIEKQYSVNAYPTYLVFSPDGQPLARAVGSLKEAKDFVARGQEQISVPEKQYYTQLRKFDSDPSAGSEATVKMANWANDQYDFSTASRISSNYIAKMADPFTKENAQFLALFTKTSKDKGFEIMLNNAGKIDAAIGEGKAKARLLSIIAGEELNPGLRKLLADKTATAPDPSAVVASASQKYPQFRSDLADMATRTIYNFTYSQEVYAPMAKAITDKTTVDWNTITANVTKKDPKNADEMVGKGKLAYYQNTKDWPKFQSEVVTFMTKYGVKATPVELNTYAWTVFENCKDMTCVTEALDWSKRSFADNKNPMFMDTYANILHKLGKTKEAIEMQEKAIALTTDIPSKKSLQETLEKMKKGEKTWTEE